MKRVLVLGAGLVSGPLVRYLTDRVCIEATVADQVLEKAEKLVQDRSRGLAVQLDARDEEALASLIESHDIVASLLPNTEHVRVARSCLARGKHLTTSSYISPEMRELHGDAEQSGLTFMNECGLDPGIDHMSAMRVIDEVRRKGGDVVGFSSYCGGLPAPDANNNPIGYKFSWAPRAVLAAATSPARFIKDGKTVEVPGDQLFADPEIIEVNGAGKFEGYPNRDSLEYVDLYGLKNIRTMIRGTLRYPGYCEAWYQWVRMGLFDQEERSDLESLTYQRFMQGFAHGAADVRKGLSKIWDLPVDHPALTNLEWLGLFKNKPIPLERGGNIDIMAHRMAEKCKYGPGERDMVVLQHRFDVEYPDKEETLYSYLVEFGKPGGDTAMARTVGLPLAIATRLILEGRIKERGVIAPVKPRIYNEILDELTTQDITCRERRG